jgi:carboxyl-terminal processing protease
MRILSLILIISIGLISPTFSQPPNNGFETLKSMELTDQIYEHLEKYYVDDINVGSLSKTAIDAMLKDLDPYTVYYHESNIEDYKLMTTGQYGGIGALIRKVDDHVCISEPYEGKPAHKSGLLAGDKIVEIDGKSMLGKSSSDVSGALKGPKGTSLQLKVLRNGKEKDFSFERDEIKLPDVPYAGMIKDKVGYIKLNSFTRTASQEVIKEFHPLKEQGMEQLVLDLRGNGGGLLIEAVKIVNMFVDKNEVVVTTKGRVEEENRTYKTMGPAIDLEIPLVVLVNESSASASEIVAGSLQDLDRAIVLGTTSYGKGLVQRTYDLDYGSKVKLTIAKYYTPSGRCVQRLEYYDREDGARPTEIADSLIKVFKTKNGRDVIDGRGIEPDIEITPKDMSRLTLTLFRKNVFFNYATKYHQKNANIDDPSQFAFTDKEYDEFKKHVLSLDISYTTASEEMLKKMKTTAEKEGFYEDLSSEYEKLLEKVVPSTDRDLDKFKDEILYILENEVVSRYFFQIGRAKHAFQDDEYIEESVLILQNLPKYDTILGN